LQFYFGQTKYTSQPDLEFPCGVKSIHFAQEVLIS
jgi:hypothetical protein